MSNKKFTLDDIRAAADEKYASVDIELGDGKTVTMLNPLRMDKTKRDRLIAVQEQMDGEDADQEALLEEALRLASKTEGAGQLLVDTIGGDLATLVEVFKVYGEAVKVGEASASADS